MSLWDDDAVFDVVGGKPHYFWGTAGEVLSAPITVEDRIEAYLFLGTDPSEDAAGLVYRLGNPLLQRLSDHWNAALDEMKARRMPAHEAVHALLGQTGPAGTGTIGRTLRPASGREKLNEELNPGMKERRLRREAHHLTEPSRTEIDAALRGEGELTRAIAQSIASLDSALSRRPTRETYVVNVWLPAGRIPADLEPGDRVFEATYLMGYSLDEDTPLPGAATRLVLRVPENVPAIPAPRELPTSPHRLLLARGIEWEAVRVLRDLTPAVVTARVVDVRRTPLAARGSA